MGKLQEVWVNCRNLGKTVGVMGNLQELWVNCRNYG